MKLNIYLNGVGGQGIGVLSELIIRAWAHAGVSVKGVDTHGLAQRGGSVESHIRVGCPDGSPLIEAGTADVVISLERTEAFRAMSQMLKPGGSLAYYDTSWQSLPVRLGKEAEITAEQIKTDAAKSNIHLVRVDGKGLTDVRFQNIKLLAESVKNGILSELKLEDVRYACAELFEGDSLKTNLEILNQY